MSRLQSWLLNAVYLGVITIALPWILWSAWRHGKYREGFSEKFWGSVPLRVGNRPCIWLHAVSVGEVNLLSKLICDLVTKRPDLEVGDLNHYEDRLRSGLSEVRHPYGVLLPARFQLGREASDPANSP